MSNEDSDPIDLRLEAGLIVACISVTNYDRIIELWGCHAMRCYVAVDSREMYQIVIHFSRRNMFTRVRYCVFEARVNEMIIIIM